MPRAFVPKQEVTQQPRGGELSQSEPLRRAHTQKEESQETNVKVAYEARPSGKLSVGRSEEELQHQKHIISPGDGEDAVEALNKNTKKLWHSIKVTASKSSQCSSVQLGLISFFAHFYYLCVHKYI